MVNLQITRRQPLQRMPLPPVHAAAADSLRRRSFHTLTPAHSASGRGEAGGQKKIEGGGEVAARWAEACDEACSLT